jgi:hypothetical protein
MPMLWRRIAWFASFAIALVFALWMRSSDYGWPATLAVAVVIWFGLPFIISQLCAAFVLGRMQHDAQFLASLSPEVQRDVIEQAPSDVKEHVADLLKRHAPP